MKLAELARVVGARLLGDGELEVTRVRAVQDAGAGDLGFADAPAELRAARSTNASAPCGSRATRTSSTMARLTARSHKSGSRSAKRSSATAAR